MISKDQLQRLAQSTGLGLYQQEKDYLLKLFLYFYYKRYQEAVFKGGTCIKYLLGLERFSEDLDFNLKQPKKFPEEVRKVLEDLQNLGLVSYFLKEESFPDAYTCEIGFQGPLFTGTPQTQNKFRIDAGYRTGTLKSPEWKLIKSEYPETGENFLVLTMNFQEILIEKLIALTERKKGRDLYDLWFLINAGIALDQKLLEKKTKEKISLKEMCSEEEYERDMKRLTTKVIPYQQIRAKVEEFLLVQ